MSFASSSLSHFNADGLLAALVHSSVDAIVVRDLDGRIMFWNPAATRMFGYSADEAIGAPLSIIFPPDRRAEEEAIVERVLRGEHISGYETVRQHKSGAPIDVALTVSPIRSATGEVVGISKILRDIRELKREQERFRITLASIGDAVICTDAAGQVTFMNVVAEQLTGWSRAEAVGSPLAEVFRILNADTRQAAPSPVEHVLAHGTVVGLANHTLLIARDGVEHPIDDSAAPIRSPAGELMGVVLVFRDVGDRYRAAATARRLAAIVEGSDDAIIAKTLDGIVTNWNPAATRIFGYEADEIVGRPIALLLPPDRPDEERQILSRLRVGERIEHFETQRRRKDGRIIHVSLTISPVRDNDGRIIGASKIARDITARKESEIALRAAQQKLETHALELERAVEERTAQLREMVGELEAFSYSLSHDLRAPLRAIHGFTDIVLADCGAQLPEDGREYLRRVVAATQRMDRLIQDVLAFSRVSRQDVTLRAVDPERLVLDLIRDRPELQPPDARITLASPLLRVRGDEASLAQCLSNLLGNAVKFVPSGRTPEVTIRTERVDGRVRLSVTDNGIGIDAENRNRLFTVFQRLATPQPYEGTGLGLAIVRKAAERMGGTVGVESAPGQGSTFWVELAASD